MISLWLTCCHSLLLPSLFKSFSASKLLFPCLFSLPLHFLRGDIISYCASSCILPLLVCRRAHSPTHMQHNTTSVTILEGLTTKESFDLSCSCVSYAASFALYVQRRNADYSRILFPVLRSEKVCEICKLRLSPVCYYSLNTVSPHFQHQQNNSENIYIYIIDRLI